MENRLIDYFKKIAALSNEEIQALKESMLIKSYKKGEHIVKEGQYNANTFFVLQGLVRQYKLVDESDISTGFYTEDQWIMPMGSGEEEGSSVDNLICVEDTWVVVGNEQKAQELFAQFPHFEAISRKLVESTFMAQQAQLSSYITDKPEQRYLNLMKNRPDILQRVAQYDIASYIGVKPESLSRIRRKLAQKD